MANPHQLTQEAPITTGHAAVGALLLWHAHKVTGLPKYMKNGRKNGNVHLNLGNTRELAGERVSMEETKELKSVKLIHIHRSTPLGREWRKFANRNTRCTRVYLLWPGPIVSSIDLSVLGPEIPL